LDAFRVGMLMGAHRVVDGDHENALDATWIEGIAAEFDAAGGASLPDLRLDGVVITAASPALTKLLKPGLTPAEAAEAYALLPQSDAYIEGLPLVAQYFFANLDGIPAAKRDIASRFVLDAAVADPEGVSQMMGILPDGPLASGDFREQVTALKDAITDADKKASRLPGGQGNRVAQLVGFGVHDEALVAAISLGDLDSANNVAINVPGMNSTVSDMTGRVGAAEDLLEGADIANSETSYAVVSWIGYSAPGPFEVQAQAHARSGAAELASFLDGVHDSRADGGPASTTVTAHSYGSTTAAGALELTEHRVDSFVSYGSVGFPTGVSASDINADAVYATSAGNDPLAWPGMVLAGGMRTDPRGLDGVTRFSSETGAGTAGVTGHDMWNAPGSEDVGYLSENSTSLLHISEIIANGSPG
jgi:hypothetical protein